MGVSKKPHQVVDSSLESMEATKKWVIAGIPLRAPLKRIKLPKSNDHQVVDDHDYYDGCSTTPTGEESRIPVKSTCPPAPRKRKATLKCNYGGREFFNSPDLESFFVCHGYKF